MSESPDSANFDSLRDWFQKGILVCKLKGADGNASNSWKHALKCLSVGFGFAAFVEFLVLLMFQKDLNFETFAKIPIFAVSPLLGLLSFLGFLLVWLWVLRVKLSARAAFSLTCYVFSGLLPLLMLFSFESLGEAIRLFLARGDPSLPYFAAATNRLLFSGQASAFAITRAWIFFVLEIVSFSYYIFWNLRRVLAESSDCANRNLRVTLSLIFALALNSLFFRFYAGRLYWSIIGQLLS